MMKQYHKSEGQRIHFCFSVWGLLKRWSLMMPVWPPELDPDLPDHGGLASRRIGENMCGIHYHASESYIARLIAKGYKVAICEQMEDPATAKGLVKRDIIRVVTPGTVIDAACLDDKAGNYLCIYLTARGRRVAFCDLSTGETHLTAFSGKDTLTHIINELGRFSPAEAILSDGAFSEKALTDVLTDKFHCRFENGGERRFRLAEAEKNIRAQFGRRLRAACGRGTCRHGAGGC